MTQRLVLIAACPLFLLASALFVSGCTGRHTDSTDPEYPVVSISQITESDSADYEDFNGRAQAIKSIELKLQATGYLTAVKFKDGDEVKKGQLLFTIDDRTYKADLDKAQGDVSRYQASLERYTADLARSRRMRIGDATSREEYDKAVANKADAQASLDSARAAVDKAKLNLQFCQISAEVSGKISRTAITEGNLVTKDQTTLTTLVSIDPIYVYFDVPERTVLRIQRLIRERKLPGRETEWPILAGTEIDPGYPLKGHLDFTDNKFDASTGTLSVRGVFDNKKRPPVLQPNMSVRVRVPIGQTQRKMVVADQAIGSDLGQKYLYVVNDKNVVEQHMVDLGAFRDGMRVVESGVKPGDWVIVKGLQRVQQGVTVEPKKVPMPTPPSRVGAETKK